MPHADADFPSDLKALEREYELVRELGQGGMAAVYLARNRRTGRLVAIKAIRSRYLDDADAVQRFTREARTVAGLEHPNIVRTEAIEQIGDRAVAIIMEHVPGGTVRDRLRERGSLGSEEAEQILRDVANALGYAHRRGIVHRDVKPENIFLDERRGRALLSDFGIARQIDGEASITLLGAALGTPQYRAPEQIDGQVVDARSDIYSLGVLGWELLTGRRPWAGESLYGVIYKQKHEHLPRITSLRPRVPANLLFAIERALVKDKKLRWQNIEEFLDQLTYNPPPLLEQAFPPGARRSDDQPTVRFRPLALVRDDDPETFEPDADVAYADVEDARPTAPTAESVFVPGPTPSQLPVAQFAAQDEELRDSGERQSEPAALSATEPVMPVLEPNADVPFEYPSGRRQALRALGLLVPLAIAASALFIVLGGAGDDDPQASRPGVVTSSAGSLAPDSMPMPPATAPGPGGVANTIAAKPVAPNVPVRPDADTAFRAPPAPSAAPRRVTPRPGGTRTGASTSGPLNPPRIDSNAAAAAPNRAADAPVGKGESAAARVEPQPEFEDPFKIPSSSTVAAPPAPRGKGAVPSPRCRVAGVPDQRACLDAYIAVGDVPLTQAFDALVTEMRRVSGTPAGAPDPQPVQRIRIEQRAWLSVRNAECPRTAEPGAGSFWAQAQSTCFAEMAASRAAELRDAVRRLKRK
jgi:serine/threonine protein kinase/uncharacterized protein YecT (DUF1311 family)